MTVRSKMRPEKMALWNEFLPDQLVEEQTTESPKPTTTEAIPDDKKGEDFFVNFSVKLPRILANFGFLKCHDIAENRVVYIRENGKNQYILSKEVFTKIGMTTYILYTVTSFDSCYSETFTIIPFSSIGLRVILEDTIVKPLVGIIINTRENGYNQ